MKRMGFGKQKLFPLLAVEAQLHICLSCGSVTIPTELIQQFFTIHLMTAVVYYNTMTEGFIVNETEGM